MLIFAGLGNPGPKHANNRHNVGFMAADAIARRHSFAPWTKKFQGEIAEGRIGDEKVLLLKPQTFMNLSGQAIGEALRFYKLDLSALTVFYDELDLAPGKVRVRVGGGAGGHNGIRSIDQHCGNAFRRVRIGIGHPGVKELVHGYVLGDFAKADGAWLEPTLEAISANADFLIRCDDPGFMNRIAVATGAGADSGRTGRQSEPGNDGSPKAKAKGQNHIRQARPAAPAIKVPDGGPMAAMLRKLLGKD